MKRLTLKQRSKIMLRKGLRVKGREFNEELPSVRR